MTFALFYGAVDNPVGTFLYTSLFAVHLCTHPCLWHIYVCRCICGVPRWTGCSSGGVCTQDGLGTVSVDRCVCGLSLHSGVNEDAFR